MSEEDRTVQYGYGELAYRARHSPIAYTPFKGTRTEAANNGRWEDVYSTYIREILDEHGVKEKFYHMYKCWMAWGVRGRLQAKDLNAIKGLCGDPVKTLEMAQEYEDWSRTVIKRRGAMCFNVAYDILMLERSFNEIEADRVMNKKTIKEHLVNAVTTQAERRHTEAMPKTLMMKLKSWTITA